MNIINKIDSYLAKQDKVYLKPGEKPPEGVIVLRGKRGGTYFYSRKAVTATNTKNDRVRKHSLFGKFENSVLPRENDNMISNVISFKRYSHSSPEIIITPNFSVYENKRFGKIFKTVKFSKFKTIDELSDFVSKRYGIEPKYFSLYFKIIRNYYNKIMPGQKWQYENYEKGKQHL